MLYIKIPEGYKFAVQNNKDVFVNCDTGEAIEIIHEGNINSTLTVFRDSPPNTKEAFLEYLPAADRRLSPWTLEVIGSEKIAYLYKSRNNGILFFNLPEFSSKISPTRRAELKDKAKEIRDNRRKTGDSPNPN